MRRETGRPDTSDLEQMISFQIGARSDADEQFGRAPPRSVFDIERDAEVQDIQRNLERLKTATDEFLENFQKKAKKKAKRRTYGLLASLLASFGVIGWLTLTSHAPDRSEAISSTAAAVRPVASASAPAVAKVSVAPRMAIVASVPVQVAASAASAATPPAVALAVAPQTASPQVLPKNKTVLALPSRSTAPAKAVATNSARSTSTPSVSAAKPILAGPAEPKPTAPVKSETPGTAADNKVFALESAQAPASTEPAVGHPTAVAQAPRKAPAAEAKRAAPARREKYGSSGVITMTPGGVVIFDQARRAQRMVLVGDQLPDGSTLKGIDVRANRISTENGDVIFE